MSHLDERNGKTSAERGQNELQAKPEEFQSSKTDYTKWHQQSTCVYMHTAHPCPLYGVTPLCKDTCNCLKLRGTDSLLCIVVRHVKVRVKDTIWNTYERHD